MQKPLPFLLCFLMLQMGVHAQTSFHAKKRNPSPSHSPSFDYVTVPVPRGERASLVGGRPALSPGLRMKFPHIQVVRDGEGNVIWLEDLHPRGASSIPQGRQSIGQAAFQFLDRVGPLLGLTNASQSFQLIETQTDEQNQTHVRMRQVVGDVPVWGGEIVVHSRNDTVRLLNGRCYAIPASMGTVPSLSWGNARERARADLATRAVLRPTPEGLAGRFAQDQHELVLYPSPAAQPRLVWHLTVHPNIVERWEYFVDAHTGQILYSYNHTCGLDGPVSAKGRDLKNVERAFGAYQLGNFYYMIDASKPMYKSELSKLPDGAVGAIWTIDAGNTWGEGMKIKHVVSNSSSNWNATAVSAHNNAGLSFDYFQKTFKRNSLNGKGGTLISMINIPDEDGKGLDNAFWNGEYMGYGNGRDAFSPLAGSLDVAGHEMTHGVVENTARLEYQGQSGAINESMADIFGILIDRDDWTLGEEVVNRKYFPSGALRSLADPNQEGPGGNGYQPKTMAQYNPTTEDNGGVHINSGIPNYAFYLIASKIGKDKSEAIYYRALSQYLTRRSQFLDLRLAIIQCATDLYGANSTETATARQAFDQVGIVEGKTEQAPKTQDLPVNSGKDALLVYGIGNSTLYQTTPQLTTFTPMTKQGLTHKASITDDGKYAYFVSADKRIRAVSLTGTPQEYVVSSEPIWSNVAISRDGTKMAALMEDSDKSIWVYSFDRKEWRKFSLYNPTYTSGVSTGEVKYADAFEWDTSGEYLVYDAFNEINNSEGEKLEYWDVGFIHIWDNKQKNFAKGQIEKLFTDLEEGENIGNPVFSKNNPSIIAFDYYDSIDDAYYLLGVNIDNGDLQLIHENNTLGFPDYSRTDEQMIFNTLSGSQENIGIIDLDKDRISPKGKVRTFIQNGKWANWFAQGTREAPAKQAQTIAFAAIGDKTLGDPNFDLSASSSSGLAVRFERLSGGISVQSRSVTISQAGKASIRSFQDGNDRFLPATTVDRTFCINPTRPVIQQDGLTLVASAQGGSQYVWYENGVVIPNATTASYSVQQSGQYSVRAVTADGCQSAVSALSQVIILANDPALKANSYVYPNPVMSELMIEGKLQGFDRRATLSDASGRTQEVSVQVDSPERWRISTHALAPGVYTIQLRQGEKQVSYKIVKE